MKHFSFAIILIFLFSCTDFRNEKSINQLTNKELKEGWILLWDGKSFDGWRGIYKDHFPENGWIIENGELICIGNEITDSIRGGDIITIRKYKNFELVFDFKIKEKANSGIKYFVDESLPSNINHGLGLEYAILDNNNWPYEKPDLNRNCGALYDLVRAPEDAKMKPLGEWNQGKILVENKILTHWLNGTQTVLIEKDSPHYKDLLSKSKYVTIPRWGDFQEGHILIQDEGPRTSFRNIKIRPF